MRTVPPLVGIDLGTTQSAVAYWHDGAAHLVPNELGDVLTPSAVAELAPHGALVVGRAAKDMIAHAPACGALGFKRSMGRDVTLPVGTRTLRPEELSAYVLDALRADVERELGSAVTRCVISVPAYFGEPQRVATRSAAEMAGWIVERIVNEPTAAALAHGIHGSDPDDDGESTFVVLDLGGGTFDVCVMERFEGLLEVKGVAGLSDLGGDDFTHALGNFCLRRAGHRLALDQLSPSVRARVVMRAELLKRQLSRWPQGEIAIPRADDPDGPTTAVTITRTEAHDVFRPLLARIVQPCREALAGARITPARLRDVLLVGGASPMPAFIDAARDLFGLEPRIDPNPDHLVAKGAAIQAALCAKDDSVSDTVVTDVLSHTLGTDVSQRIGDKHVDGFFSPIIHRNTVIPAARSRSYQTVEPNQRELTFGIYEGEARRVADNVLLGTLTVTDLPPSPTPQSVELTFAYDVSGILDVEAKIEATGATVAKTFVRDRSLSPQDIERARARLRQIKTDIRQRPRYREAIARAELLWREGDAERRHALGYALTAFEDALATGDPTVIEPYLQHLLHCCRTIDHDERW